MPTPRMRIANLDDASLEKLRKMEEVMERLSSLLNRFTPWRS